VRDACRAATEALVTHYNPAKTLASLDAMDDAIGIVERNARRSSGRPGSRRELRTIIGECQAPAWVADKARYAELMRTRSSRAGDFHAKFVATWTKRKP